VSGAKPILNARVLRVKVRGALKALKELSEGRSKLCSRTIFGDLVIKLLGLLEPYFRTFLRLPIF
jgi:hypothetical protein